MAPKKPAAGATRRQPKRLVNTEGYKHAMAALRDREARNAEGASSKQSPKKNAAVKANTAEKRAPTKAASKPKPAGVKKMTSPKKKETPKKVASTGKKGRPAGSARKSTTAKSVLTKNAAARPSSKVRESVEFAVEEGEKVLRKGVETAKKALTPKVTDRRSRSMSPAKALMSPGKEEAKKYGSL